MTAPVFSENFPRIAIVGAGRTRNGLGPFIAKFFQQHGAPVVAVLGASEKSAAQASGGLTRFGIHAHAYWDFDRMIAGEHPDAIAIASPMETHDVYLEKSLGASCHIFCEKPFVWRTDTDMAVLTGKILQRARRCGLTVCLNSQLPFLMAAYELICGKIAPRELKTFQMRMSPRMAGGAFMIPDSIPHPLSLLYYAAGDGYLQEIEIVEAQTGMEISFDYVTPFSKCKIEIVLIRKNSQPRTLRFGFNGRQVSRLINLPDYAMMLKYKSQRVPIRDPLERSVVDFLDAVRSNKEPLVGPAHILRTTTLLQELFVHYEKQFHPPRIPSQTPGT
jgi:predicted dehydrogenase